MYSGTVAELGSSYVHMPIKRITMMEWDKSLSFEVTDDDMAAAVQAFSFIKYVSANPDALIATEFQKAMKTKPSDDHLDALINAVDAFFAGQTSFSKVTYDAWYAIFGWRMSFFSPWTGTYYLYQTTTPADATAPLVIAQVVIAADNTAKIAIADDSGEVSAASQACALTMVGDWYDGPGRPQRRHPNVAPAALDEHVPYRGRQVDNLLHRIRRHRHAQRRGCARYARKASDSARARRRQPGPDILAAEVADHLPDHDDRGRHPGPRLTTFGS
jgi:hypothetical protein